MSSPAPARARLISTAEGTRHEAFGPGEWGLLGSAALMWGSSFLLIDIGVRSFAPGVVAWMRIACGALVLAALGAWRGRIERADWPRVVVLVITWMGVPFVLFPVAQQWVASSLAGMINASLPLFAAALAAVLLRRAPGPAQLAGLVVGFAGVVLVTLPTAGEGRTTALGVGLLVIATALYGVAVNVAVPLQQRYGSLPVLFRTQLGALVLLLPLLLAGLPRSELDLGAVGAVAALGVFGTGLAFVAMTALLGRAGATRASVVTYFFPVIAIALGVIFLHESVDAAALVGTALVLGGAVVVGRSERRAPADVGRAVDRGARAEPRP